MGRRFHLHGPTLRRTRKAHGYASAALLATATGLTPRQVYLLETGRTTIAETDYDTLLTVFGLPDGALRGTSCPHCGHTTEVPGAA